MRAAHSHYPIRLNPILLANRYPIARCILSQRCASCCVEAFTMVTALEEFIPRREQRRVVELLGQLDWDNSFDHKAERSRL